MTTWFTLGALYRAQDAFVAPPGGPAPVEDARPGPRRGPWRGPGPDGAGEVFGQVARTALLAAVLSFVLASVAAGAVTRVLTRPLVALTEGARRLAEGERGLRLELPRERDELRALTDAFNGLVTGLERQEAWRRRLVADIAHDLRTPLAVLRSEIEAMQDGLQPTDDAALARLHHEVLHLARLVGDLRTLSLAEGGGLEPRLEPLAVAPFLRATAEAFAARAARANASLAVAAPPGLGVRADAAQLRRVLGNLVDNALRHAPGPIELAAMRAGEGRIRLEVRDRGPGLSDEALERAFERFYRADRARVRGDAEGGGSGLGLAIARALVEAQGGRLEAANRPGGGAVFAAVLPEAVAPPEG